MEERLIEIESKLAYQEDLIHALNEIVARQNEELAGLSNRFQRMLEILKENMQEGDYEFGLEDERPPHY